MIHNSITFGDINSVTDMGIIITDKSSGGAQRQLVTTSVPYSNKPLAFDFSDIFGSPIYSAKDITYTFTIIENCESGLFDKHRKAREWLLSCGLNQLWDSDNNGYYYVARCTKVSDLKRISKRVGSFVATFVADPFMRTIDYNIKTWDSLIFNQNDNLNLRDYTATTAGKTYDIYNNTDVAMSPVLHYTKSSADDNHAGLTLTIGDKSWAIFRYNSTGFRLDELILQSGKNTITLTGYGTISVEIYDEVI